jgi:micrococcal nuclease
MTTTGPMRTAPVIVILWVAAACSSKVPAADRGIAVVERVVDGDTIDVVIGDNHERVRLIGIDTPEIAHPASNGRPANPAECFGDEAHRFTESLLPAGTEVRLARDVVPRDDYGRLLAYVYLAGDDGVFVNLELARQGYAQPLTIEPNDTLAAMIVDAAVSAEQSEVGLWNAC